MVGGTSMSERENIFARIREALSIEAHPHGSVGLPTPADHRRVMPATGATIEEQVALFAKNAADLRADFKQVSGPDGAREQLNALAQAGKWQRVATHDGEWSRPAAESLGLPVAFIEQGIAKDELGRCDAGITECDALVAQTGTVLVTSRSAGGRALSCLPPHHVVLARRSQLVPDLPAGFALLKQRYGGNFPSMISFITGPSRTGDIERILVLGAHGPKQLTILCLDS
jgi:L-lactate dehydrogenase complex protein LldG